MRPTTRCVLLFAGGVPVALLPGIAGEALWVVWPAWVVLSLLLCGADAVLCMRAPRVRLAVPDTLYVGAQDPLRVEVEPGAGPRARAVEVLCDLHEHLAPQPKARVALPSGGAGGLDVPLVPRRRGMVRLDAVWLRWEGPFGLVRRQLRHALGHEIPVVPDVRTVRQAALRFHAQRQYVSGLKVERYLGDGSEFESLREYVPGLDPRSMNWKATARHRRLTCTDYRAERNHQVIVALDTGHRMGEPLLGLPRLDRAINAALLLSHVCLRTGDRVGWFAFDEAVRSFAEPGQGAAAYRRLRQLSADVPYTHAETNFTLGLAELSLRLRRRSLVVLLTDFVDTITAELMVESLARLSRRHLVLFVALRDPSLAAVAAREPETPADLYRAVVAMDFVRERDLVLKKLRRIGVRCVDAPPDRVTAELLNTYLEAKRRELF